jgi:hypothetical protein
MYDAALAPLVPVATAIVFVALGAWLYRHRRADLWVRLGVIAVVTRFLAYHRVYDDVLIVLALVALFRVATTAVVAAGAGDRQAIAPDAAAALPAARDSRSRTMAAALLGTSMFFMLLPARLGTAPPPWNLVFGGTHTVTWLATLAFLCWYAAGAPHSRSEGS